MKKNIKLIAAMIAIACSSTAALTPAQAEPVNLLPPAVFPAEPVDLLPSNWDTLSKPLPATEQSPSAALPVDKLTDSAPKPAIADKDVRPTKIAPAYQNPRQVDCIASAIHHEARGEPMKGKIAIAEVILARVKSKKFAATPCAVVAQRGQFSFVRGGRIPSVPLKSLEEMRTIARQVMSGQLRTRVRGALYFHAKRIRPSWGTQLAGRIGNHVFYMK